VGVAGAATGAAGGTVSGRGDDRIEGAIEAPTYSDGWRDGEQANIRKTLTLIREMKGEAMSPEAFETLLKVELKVRSMG